MTCERKSLHHHRRHLRLDRCLLLCRQLRALRVDELVADAACGHDLIGGEAVLRDFDDMPSGGQSADRYRAVSAVVTPEAVKPPVNVIAVAETLERSTVTSQPSSGLKL